MWSFLQNDKIILASASPRRREMFAGSGLIFSVKPADIEEVITNGPPPAELVKELALRKALTAASGETNAWIVGADTIVVLDDKILGKPSDSEDAKRILAMLSGRTHIVYTGFAILHLPGGERIVDYEATHVTFLPLSVEEIENYVSTGESLDKAGAYGIQKAGALLVEKVDGCYFNVVGLPIAKLRAAWKKLYSEISHA